jgi:hypothetical protein
MNKKDATLGYLIGRGTEALLKSLLKPKELLPADDQIKELKEKLYGRSEKEIEMIIQAMIDIANGRITNMPETIKNIMSPTLPENQDYSQYDNAIKDRMGLIENKQIRMTVSGVLIDEMGSIPMHMPLRKARNLHKFQLLKLLASSTNEEFLEYVNETYVKQNYNYVTDKYGIPMPFIPVFPM